MSHVRELLQSADTQTDGQRPWNRHAIPASGTNVVPTLGLANAANRQSSARSLVTTARPSSLSFHTDATNLASSAPLALRWPRQCRRTGDKGRISSPRTNRKQARKQVTPIIPLSSTVPCPTVLYCMYEYCCAISERTRAADNDGDRGKTVKEPWTARLHHRVLVQSQLTSRHRFIAHTKTHKHRRQHHQQRHSNPSRPFSQPSFDTALPNGGKHPCP